MGTQSMKNRTSVRYLNRLIPLLASLLAATVSGAQSDPIKDFVTTAKDAYLMLPPRAICGPHISQMVWSPDGEKLAILRIVSPETAESIAAAYQSKTTPTTSPEDLITQVLTWNSKSEKSTMIFSVKGSDGQVTSIDWVAGSSSMIVTALDTTQPATPISKILLINANGQSKLIATVKDDETTQAQASPTRPVVALVNYPFSRRDQVSDATQPPSTVRFFGVEGVLSKPISLPSPQCHFMWSPTGQPLAMMRTRAQGANKSTVTWFNINRENSTVTPTVRPSNMGQPVRRFSPEDELQVQDLSRSLAVKKVGVEAPTILVSSSKAADDAFGIITTDGKGGDLSPNQSAVAYISQGTAMVRPLAKVPLEAYRLAKVAALKRSLLNKAKQVALALLMHASDNNDNYVSNKSDWRNAINPYIKDSNIYDGFNYVFPGGNASSIAEPASTVLGYFEGPGGRAVAYTDGHAKWINNP